MIARLIAQLRDRGVVLELTEDGRIHYVGELTDEEVEAIRQHRDLVIHILALDAGDLTLWQRTLH